MFVCMNVCVGRVDDLHTSSVSERSSGVNTFLKKNCFREREREGGGEGERK